MDSSGDRLYRWEPEGAPGYSFFGYDTNFEYFPGESVVAFATYRDNFGRAGSVEIAAARLDGSGYRRLTTSKGDDFNPAWSPDGKQIAFVSYRAGFQSNEDNIGIGDYGIYVMDSDGETSEGWRRPSS